MATPEQQFKIDQLARTLNVQGWELTGQESRNNLVILTVNLSADNRRNRLVATILSQLRALVEPSGWAVTQAQATERNITVTLQQTYATTKPEIRR